jgi:hypothetical protein
MEVRRWRQAQARRCKGAPTRICRRPSLCTVRAIAVAGDESRLGRGMLSPVWRNPPVRLPFQGYCPAHYLLTTCSLEVGSPEGHRAPLHVRGLPFTREKRDLGVGFGRLPSFASLATTGRRLRSPSFLFLAARLCLLAQLYRTRMGSKQITAINAAIALPFERAQIAFGLLSPVEQRPAVMNPTVVLRNLPWGHT